MKTTPLAALVALCIAGSTCRMRAADFTSGSDGSYGPMNIATNTALQLPPSGIFNCTTITIAQGATLTFRRNALNTPVYLLATGDVIISGTINLNGQAGSQGNAGAGGPGGFDGGAPAQSSGEPAGDGHGPGAGKAIGGSYSQLAAYGSLPGVPAQFSTNGGAVYGSPFLQPLVGGSGGAGSQGNPGYGGGGGGGALLIASTTIIRLNSGGTILANGGAGAANAAGPGSGGAIRVVAPLFQGSGIVGVTGAGNGPGNYASGQGRIRVDVLDRSGWNFNFQGKFSAGSKMVVFPPVIPRLDIIEAAGQSIPFGTNSIVSIDLPSTASSNQMVRIRVTDFTNAVPISVVVVPDVGPSSSFSATLVPSVSNVAETNVNVVLTPGALNRIYCWTR